MIIMDKSFIHRFQKQDMERQLHALEIPGGLCIRRNKEMYRNRRTYDSAEKTCVAQLMVRPGSSVRKG